MASDDDLVKEFLLEGHEAIDRLDRELLALEKDPHDLANLASIFRTVHTLKGTSGFFGFDKLQALTHAAEGLLSKLRAGQLVLDRAMADALYALVDAVRRVFASIETTGTQGTDVYGALIERFTALHAVDVIPDAGAPAKTAEAPGSLTAMFTAAAAATQTAVSKPTPPPASAQANESRDHVALTPKIRGDDQRDVTVNALADSTLRVEVALLDSLMNAVGELVLVRNQLVKPSGTHVDEAMRAAAQHLDLLTTQLQEGVMKTRMQPIDAIWSKYPRIVRDLAQFCGKQVRIEMEGQQTELDKTLIEAIRDPLTHIVRNAIDHGIELPQLRTNAGKNPQGLLTLRAYHEGGLVNIEVTDDGAGINPEKVKAKALEKGLITLEASQHYHEGQVLSLIFLPGFSTAERVTSISGRGVGMDVVKTNIERIGGTVDLINRPGLGTTLHIKIPMTLAIVPALLVSCGGERFAIPQANLLELVRLGTTPDGRAIEEIRGTPVFRLRGKLLPVIFLDRQLCLPVAPPASARNLVVVHTGDRRFGLVVDAVSNAEEIVVKPLDPTLKALKVYSGATILGDGHIALILDILALGMRAKAFISGLDSVNDPTAHDAEQMHQSLLVFISPDDGRMAIPLNKITRLEELPRAAIEQAGGLQVVQYRNEILPLVPVFSILPERRQQPRNPGCGVPSDRIQLAIHEHEGRRAGLVIGTVLDAIEVPMLVSQAASRPGVLGCMVIAERVTEMLDVEAMVRSVLPTFYDRPAAASP